MGYESALSKIASYLTRPLVLMLLLVGLTLVSFSHNYRLITQGVSDAQIQDLALVEPQQKNIALSINQIVAMDLFGKPAVKETVPVKPENLPSTRLKLRLKGVFVHSDQTHSSALISSDKKKGANIYVLGESVPGGATLEEVYPEYVVLKRAGRFEKLLFERVKKDWHHRLSGERLVDSRTPNVNVTQTQSSAPVQGAENMGQRLQQLREQFGS